MVESPRSKSESMGMFLCRGCLCEFISLYVTQPITMPHQHMDRIIFFSFSFFSNIAYCVIPQLSPAISVL